MKPLSSKPTLEELTAFIARERTPEELAEYAEKEARREEESRRNEESRLNAQRDSLWAYSGVPLRHSQKSVEMPLDGPWGATYDQIKGRMGTGVILAFMGKRGAGKTQMAVSLIRHSCRNLRPAKYVKAITIFLTIRGCYKNDGGDELSVIKEFSKPSLLVIDAMEERGETPFEDRILNHIIDARYDVLKDTILITNQTPEAFAESVGPSIVSRIHEVGEKVVFDWPSFREANK